MVAINVAENSRERRDDTIQGGTGDDTLRLEITQEQYDSGNYDDALFEAKDYFADVADGKVDAGATGRFDDLNVRASGFEQMELSVDGRTVELNRKPVIRGVEAVQIDFTTAAEPVEISPSKGPELVGEDGIQILDQTAGDNNRGGRSEGNASNDQAQDGGAGGEATTALLSRVEITDDDREDNLESATVTIDNLGDGAEVLFDTGDTGIEVKVTHVEGGGVRISFEGSADPSAYTAVLRSVSVKNDTVSQDGGSHEISVSVEDEHGVASDPATADLEIIEDPNAVEETGSEAATGVDLEADDSESEDERGGKSEKVKDLNEEDDEKATISEEDDKSKGKKSDEDTEDKDASDKSSQGKVTGDEDADDKDDSGKGGSDDAKADKDAKGADSDSEEDQEVAGDSEEKPGKDKSDADVDGKETGALTGADGGDDAGDFDGSGDEEDFALYAELDSGSESSPDWMTVSEQPADDAVVSTGDEAAANDDWSGGDTVEVSDTSASEDLDSSIQISTLV